MRCGISPAAARRPTRLCRAGTVPSIASIFDPTGSRAHTLVWKELACLNILSCYWFLPSAHIDADTLHRLVSQSLFSEVIR